MSKGTVFKSLSKLMIAAMLISPLQGCLVNTGNVRTDSLGSAFTDFLGSAGLSQKKAWPFAPTENEMRVSRYSHSVMAQAMTSKSVTANIPASDMAFLKAKQAKFNSFMSAAPQMSEWTNAQANEYVGYLRDLLPITDAVLAASEQSGSTSDASFRQSALKGGSLLIGNTLRLPAHSSVSVGMQAACADEDLPPPADTEYPAQRLVPASFASVVPVQLAGHVRNMSNSLAKRKSTMDTDSVEKLVWAMTQVDTKTSSNNAVFRSSNQNAINKVSPGLYQDWTALNNQIAKTPASGYLPSNRAEKTPTKSVVALPVANASQYMRQNTTSQLLDGSVYYNVKNNSHNPILTFYNAGNTEMSLDLTKYNLVNDGSLERQRFILTGAANNVDGTIKGGAKSSDVGVETLALAKMIAMDVTRFSISKGSEYLGELGKNPAFLAHQQSLIKQMGSNTIKNFFRKAPLVASIIAANEAYTGKDFVSGRDMTGIERGLAALEAAPIPGARAEAMAAKMNWTKIAAGINAYGNTVRGSLYWEAAGYGLEAYKQTLGSTGDYLSGKWSDQAIQTEGQKALIFINNSGGAIDKFVASYAL
ncbi:hypothetical protein RYA05_05840 [Pseudomonas syringae pv. actinidiae]|nr:hypothetical protein [Pseudomonas syringae pv. actinidiae]